MPPPAWPRSFWGWTALALGGATVLALTVLAPPPAPQGTSALPENVRVTGDDGSIVYLRADGRSDAVTAACGTGRREQNEPAVAVDPRDPSIVVAGANDFCTGMVTGDAWMGYYRSTDGGRTWSNSLVPGYPTDRSPHGRTSPARGTCSGGSDPTMAFDQDGRLFYGFICITGTQRRGRFGGNEAGSMMVAVYEEDGGRYEHTALVWKGSPGATEDKPNLTVDQTDGPRSGSVYVAWTEFSVRAGNVLLFARSTDHGETFSDPVPVTGVIGLSPDLSVGPDGSLYLSYRSILADLDAIWLLRSDDGGESWSDPAFVAEVHPFDSKQFAPRGRQECGDGPYACRWTFSRFSTKSAVVADETGVHVLWSARTGPGRQAKIFVRNSPDGLRWPEPPRTVDHVARGHQYEPDVASSDGVVTVVFYDSRNDRGYDPDRPPGNTAEGRNSGGAVDVFAATSEDGGKTWNERRVTRTSSNFNWEVPDQLPFWGDYIYVSAVPGTVHAVWTDSRDIVPGKDPRETGSDDDHDGFDVLAPCRYVPNDIDARRYRRPFLNDPCLSRGGHDQNIYAARL